VLLSARYQRTRAQRVGIRSHDWTYTATADFRAGEMVGLVVTDLAGGDGRIGFALDDRFLMGGPHRVAVKATYHDMGRGRWSLVYARPGGNEGRRTVECRDTEKVFTATFHLPDACFPGAGDAFDFTVEAEGEDATVSFIRVIKARGQEVVRHCPEPPAR